VGFIPEHMMDETVEKLTVAFSKQSSLSKFFEL
jgi:hypothetical protein